MVFVGFRYAVIATELLVGAVIGVDAVLPAVLQPFPRGLDAEVIVFFPCKRAFPVGTFQNTLGQCHRGGDAVTAHLLHRVGLIFFRINLVLVFCHFLLILKIYCQYNYLLRAFCHLPRPARTPSVAFPFCLFSVMLTSTCSQMATRFPARISLGR